MSTLRALLEIYGSLDTAVIDTGDRAVAEVADQLLPGTSENAGWYRELEEFMFPVGDRGRAEEPLSEDDPDRPRTEANPLRALAELNGARLRDEPTPTIPELSRLVYGIGAIIRLKSAVPSAPLPRLDEGSSTDGNRALLADVLALAGPSIGFTDNRGLLDDELLDRTVTVFSTTFTSWQAWPDVVQVLEAMNVLSAEVASVPLCQAAVITIDGIDSVVVDTRFEATDVSLDALKAVVDPRNWRNNYPSFFCSMEDRGTRPDGWRKVLETVGFCYVEEPYGRRLRTMLKFTKSEKNDPDDCVARLDYDLNDPVPDPAGDGQIDVDRGFINMWAPGGKADEDGVVVRTRKVAHIKGIRPYTQKRFVCIFGYGQGAMEMLFGPAKNPDGKVAYYPWADAPDAGDPGTGSSAAPGTSPNSAASTAFKLWADCANDLTVKNLDLTDRWLAGKLTLADLADYSAQVGARLASDPWKFMEAISKPKGGGT